MEESKCSYCDLKIVKQTKNIPEQCCFVGGEIQTKSKTGEGENLSSIFLNTDISMWSGEILGHVNHHCTQGLGGQNHAAVHQLSFLHPLSSFMSRRTQTKTRSPHSKHREVFSFNQHQPTVGREQSTSRYSDCQLHFLLSFPSFIWTFLFKQTFKTIHSLIIMNMLTNGQTIVYYEALHKCLKEKLRIG